MRDFIRKQIHAARVRLDYHRTTDRPSRIPKEQKIAQLEAKIAALVKQREESKPFEPTLTVRNGNFIGPKRKRGVRGDGPTIVCFRCEYEKPRKEFYAKGTLCKACIVKRSGEWAAKNPGKRKNVRIKWDDKNRNIKLEKARQWYRKTIKYQRDRGKKYRANNREKCNKTQREYLRRRKNNDPKFRALSTCKRRMWILFKSVGRKKVMRSKELLGIDRAGFFTHLESLFKPGMTWANRGKYGWHIDHIKPCALFDMTDLEQAKACWHYTNLQPLWCHENWKKSDNYEEPKIIDGLNKPSVAEFATVEQSTA